MEDTTENGAIKKVKIEVDPDGPEEVIIRCRHVTPEVIRLQGLLESGTAKDGTARRLSLTLGEEEHLVDPRRILFFETADGRVAAHTDKRVYYTEMKLYELEEVLPKCFMRISKACVLNLDAVASLRRELTGLCRVGFANCAKEVYISRMYYRPFREKLDEMRMI